MKKMKKYMLLVMLAIFTMSMAIPVQAKTETMVFTWYPAKDKDFLGNSLNAWNYSSLKDGTYLASYEGKISNLKSSNPAVVSVKSKKEYSWTTVYAKIKKPGNATVSYKYKENGKTKSRTIKVLVKKYVNPIKSIKVGTTVIKGSKFKNTSVYKGNYSKFANQNVSIKIVPEKGWVLDEWQSPDEYMKIMKKIEKAEKKGDYDTVDKLEKKLEKIPNVPTFNLYKKGYAKDAVRPNGDTVKISGGIVNVTARLENKKTKQYEEVSIYFKK